MLLAEGRQQPCFVALIENVASMTNGRVCADNTAFSIEPSSHKLRLLEEPLFAGALGNLDVVMVFAEIQNCSHYLILSAFKDSLES